MKIRRIVVEIAVSILLVIALGVVLVNALVMVYVHNLGENALGLILFVLGVLLSYIQIPLWKSIVSNLQE